MGSLILYVAHMLHFSFSFLKPMIASELEPSEFEPHHLNCRNQNRDFFAANTRTPELATKSR